MLTTRPPAGAARIASSNRIVRAKMGKIVDADLPFKPIFGLFALRQPHDRGIVDQDVHNPVPRCSEASNRAEAIEIEKLEAELGGR